MVASCFGWSAGDIALAINVIVKVGQAFRTAGGAAAKYRDAAAFLESLKVTLDRLRTHAADDKHDDDGFGADIAAQLARMTGPWKAFEAFVLRFEARLGGEEANLRRRDRIAQIGPTVKFTLKDISGEVDKLRLAAAQPLQIINTLLSLQLIRETRLVPQRLLSEAQCGQLVEAIHLAAVPGALAQRLDVMEGRSENALAQVRTDLLHQMSQVTALIKSFGDPAGSQKVAETDLDEGRPSSSRNIAREESTFTNDLSASARSLVDFRLLVEDQHWGVIQLLRALQQQLNEIERNGPLVLTERAVPYSRLSRNQISSKFATAAVTLIATMTTGITTGIVVGKAAAAAGASHVSASLANSNSFGGQRVVSVADDPATVRHDQDTAVNDPMDARNDQDTTVEDSAKVRDDQDTAVEDPANVRTGQDTAAEDPANVRSNLDTAVEGTKGKSPSFERESNHAGLLDEQTQAHDVSAIGPVQNEMIQIARIPKLNMEQLTCPRDSVIEDTETSTGEGSTYYVGSKHEQVVVRMRDSIPTVKSSAHCYSKFTKSYRVPECLNIALRDQHSFFIPGRVFMTAWTGISSNVFQDSKYLADLSYIGPGLQRGSSQLELRRFMVMKNEGPYSLCVPIYLNTTKNSTRPAYELPISMTDGRVEEAAQLAGEDRFLVKATTDVVSARVPNNSVVKLREVCMVEHSVKAVEIGCMGEEETACLEQLWRDANRDHLRAWLFEDDRAVTGSAAAATG